MRIGLETSPRNAFWGRRWSRWAGLALAWTLSVAWSGDARAEFFVSNISNNFANGTVSQVGDGGGAATPFATGFSNPIGLALDAAGNLYVSNQGNNTVSVVGPGGGAATVFATGFSNPSGLAFDAAGNLYVANSNTNSVIKVTPGGMETTFATGFSAPQGPGVRLGRQPLRRQLRYQHGERGGGPAAAAGDRVRHRVRQPVRPGNRRRR